MLFEGTQLGRGLETEVVQRRAGLAVGGERVGLPARAVEGEHVLGAEALAVRVIRDERVQLGGRCCVEAVCEVEVETRLERAEAGVVQARGFGLREGLVREVGERGAAPERERPPRVMRGEQPLEALGVELIGRDADEVAGGTRQDPVRAEQASERMDVHLERVLGARRRISPQIPSIRRSVETATFGWRSSWASSARGRGPPSGTATPPSSSTSSGPKSRNSTP